MLRVTTSRRGLLSVSYDVRFDGRRVASWTARTWAPERELTIEGKPYLLRAERTARFHLEGEHRARADRSVEGPFAKRHWNVTVDELTYRMSGSGAGKRFALLTPQDSVNEAGRIWRSGPMRPSYAAELPDALPVPVQVFLMWTAMAIWRAAAAASSTAAVAAGGASAGASG